MITKALKCAVVCTVILFFSCDGEQQQTDKAKNDDKLPVTAIAIPVNDGWGYEIYVDNQPFIKQETIPAAEGFQTFKSREDALRIAKLVMAKMKEGKKFPAVTMEELQQAKIAMNSATSGILKQ